MTIHIDGFEQFGGETDPSEAIGRANYNAAGRWAIVAGRGAVGNVAISGQTTVLTRVVDWNGGKFAVGFAHQFDRRGSVAWLKIGQKQIVLWLNPDTGSPSINDNAGNAIPTTNRWYYYELEIDRALGRVYLYINNRLDSTYDLGYTPIEQEVIVNLGYLRPMFYRPDVTPEPIDNAVKTYDDLYINDGPRVGPITVTTRFPTNDNNVQWFAADAGKSHSESLSMHPPNPLDNYVASNTIGDEDRFTSNKPLNNANAIIATGIVVMARRSPEFMGQLGVFLGGRPGADLRQDVRIVPSVWVTQYVCFDRNINDTVGGMTAADFGINVSPL